MAIFKPSLIANSIYDIDGEKLKRAGIKGIILDWNNTIVTENFKTSDPVLKWLKELKARYGIKYLIVSNSKPPKQGNDLTDEIPALFEAGKPKKAALNKAMNILGIHRNETAIIGNGILTDIWNGNRLNLYTIFVSPLWTEPRFVGTLKRVMIKLLRI